MATTLETESTSDVSIDSNLEWELDQGIPQTEDPFIQKYMQGREKLIEQEKKQRHDVLFKSTLSPIAKQAAKILRQIRRKELETTWTSSYDESLAERNGGNSYPGMMFTLARDKMEKESRVWQIIERMPKGALLHAHLDAMFDVDWLVEQVMREPGLCIMAPQSFSDEDSRNNGRLEIRYVEDPPQQGTQATDIWSNYQPMTPVPVVVAAQSFPGGGVPGFKRWLIRRCTIDQDEALYHHHGLDAIWRKFQSCFLTIGWLLFYEPIFRRGMQRLLQQLKTDGISYVDFRVAFMFEFRLIRQRNGEPGNYMEFFRVFGEEIKKFQETEQGRGFHGARMIWTTLRRLSNKDIVPSMLECVRVKQAMPHLIAGFDFVGQEDTGRTLADLVPMIFWFRKQCVEAGVEIPFFFHAGECLGDGDSTDQNLYDAILLGTRRIGHGYSLYKHPLLIDMVKEKKILVESCPISNEILRLSSSIKSHTLPALLARGVSICLNNDDPAILGHGKNGLSHDYWQTFMALENLGLEGLATLTENSVRWSALEDQSASRWSKDITEGYLGGGIRAERLRQWRNDFEKFCQWIIIEYALDDEEGEEGEEANVGGSGEISTKEE